jgi:dolichyl-phosphate-mannose-protein mannosyltransferase
MTIPYSNPLPERMDSLYYKQPTSVQQDHIPVPMEDVAYATGLTTTSETFRKRNQGHYSRKLNSDYDDSDLDLANNKSHKFATRKEAVHKLSRKRDWYIVLALTLWACYIRLYKISQPSSVV